MRECLRELDYILMPQGTILYVGTPHSFYSIYAEQAREEAGEAEPFLAGFARLTVPLLNGADESAWPERFPRAEVERIRRRTGPARFTSQMMLQPVSPEACRLDPDRLVPYDHELDYREANGIPTIRLGERRLVSAIAWWDPAFGVGGDGSAIAAVFQDGAGDCFLHRIRWLGGDRRANDAQRQCDEAAGLLRDLHMPRVFVESNGPGGPIPRWLQESIGRVGATCAVIPKPSTRSKDARILDAFDALLAAGRLYAHRSVWDTLFIHEMREWRPGGRSRDDGLDAVAGCLLGEPYRFPTASRPPPRRDWRPGAVVHVADSSFPA
jgi:hypothetical protein